MPIGSCVRLVAVAFTVSLIAASAAAQDSVESFYKGKQISLIVGSSAGGGYDTYARLLARHFGQRHPRQSDRGGAEHERRRLQPRRGLHLFGRAEGRHRDRRDLPRRGAAAAAERRAGAARSEQARLSRQRQQRRLCLLRAQRRGGEDLQGPADQGAHHRRQQSRRHHLRPAAAAQQHRSAPSSRSSPAIPAAARSRSRSTAARSRAPAASAGPASSRCIRTGSRKDKVRVLVQLSNKGHPDLNKRGVPLAEDARQERRRQAGDPAGVQPGHVRPALCAAARRAGRARRGAAQRPSCRRSATRRSAPRPTRCSSTSIAMSRRRLAKAGRRPLCHAAAPGRAGAAGIDRQGRSGEQRDPVNPRKAFSAMESIGADISLHGRRRPARPSSR